MLWHSMYLLSFGEIRGRIMTGEFSFLIFGKQKREVCFMAKTLLRIALLLSCLFCDLAKSIILKDSGSVNETLSWECLEPDSDRENLLETTFECTKRNLYLNLRRNIDSKCMDIGDGVSFVLEGSDRPSTREIFPEGEPATLRGLMDAYSTFLSQRKARWDLGFVYPGLVLRIGPTLTGSGVLEFGLEKRLDYQDRAKLGPGQMIIRRTILPHLLGFRMNLSSLLPLIIGVILIVTKNAFVFSKVTLGLSILLTLKTLFLLQTFRPNDDEFHTNRPQPVQHDPVDLDDGFTITTVTRPRPQGYSITETLTDTFINQMANKLQPFRGIQGNLVAKRSKKGERNFSWERK